MTTDTTDHPATLIAYLYSLARQDLGSDAAQQDLDYHVGWLLGFSANQLRDYIVCLESAS